MNLKCQERTQKGQMGVDAAKCCQGLTVNTVGFGHRRGPVFYASLPCVPSAAETLRGYETHRERDKQRLVSFLWDHLVTNASPLWKRLQSSGKTACPIKVVRGLLGRPHLLLGKYQGPAISFSEGGGHLWAALCADVYDIGIDVAVPDEFKRGFQREYPFDRVFHPQELQHALKLSGGDLEDASALLWSVKEAAVKALGCAFHLVDPLQLLVSMPADGAAVGAEEEPILEDCGYTFTVDLSGKALLRVPIAARGSIWVRSIPQGKMWLSIALLERRSTGTNSVCV